MRVNKPIPKLTIINLEDIVYKFPTKHEIGFTINEVHRLLKPNKIEGYKFIEGMFSKTYTKIEGDDIFYHRDVYNILRGLI